MVLKKSGPWVLEARASLSCCQDRKGAELCQDEHCAGLEALMPERTFFTNSWPLMYPQVDDGYFQQDNPPLRSEWFEENNRSPQSTEISSKEHFWDDA